MKNIPAFPHIRHYAVSPEDEQFSGASLLDLIAIASMQGEMANSASGTYLEEVTDEQLISNARFHYRVANAMLTVRLEYSQP